jgi:hypothetical protein
VRLEGPLVQSRMVGVAIENFCVRHPGRGLSLEGMGGATSEGTVTWLWRNRRVEEAEPPQLHTIKDVVEACGLPGPVIMQLVPRTWTDQGWMYTTEQLDAAVVIAAEHRRTLAARPDPAPYR